MDAKKTDVIGEIVVGNPYAAQVFNQYGIDYYSRGDRTLEHACIDGHVPMHSILEDLWGLEMRNAGTPDFQAMNMTELSTYILRTHHRFTERKLVFIRNTMDRIKSRTRADERGLDMLRTTFESLSVHLTVHMKHEEFIVFPWIQKIAKTASAGKLSRMTGQPVNAMKSDHDQEASLLRKLSDITGEFTPPAESDYALITTYAALRELTDDLKVHMHLENNLLFPRAIALSQSIHTSLN